MVVQHHILVSICLALLLITCSVSDPISTRPLDPHHQFDAEKQTVTRTSPRNRGGRRRSGGSGGSRTGGGSQNCDPLYEYLFGRCGRWPFPRNSPNNPFTPRPSPRRPPPIPSPVVPSPPPPPVVPSPPPPPLVPSPPPPSLSPPPPPLVASPPPPPPVLLLSPPPDYILPPQVPELPPDYSFQAPPYLPIPFSPPTLDIYPPPIVPISFSPPVEWTTPFPGMSGELPEIIMPPPLDENPVTEVQPLFSTPQTPEIPIDMQP